TLPLSGGIIGSGVDELRWPRPVRPGDTLRLHCEIIDVQESKLRPASGTVRVRMTTLNQNDQPVQTMIANLLAFRRPEQAAGWSSRHADQASRDAPQVTSLRSAQQNSVHSRESGNPGAKAGSPLSRGRAEESVLRQERRHYLAALLLVRIGG